MQIENCYIIASKDVIHHADTLSSYLKTRKNIPYNIINVCRIPKHSEEFLTTDFMNLIGAETADVMSYLVSDDKHRGIIISNSANGVLFRANMYPNLRCGTAVNQPHAVDAALRAQANVLALPAQFMTSLQIRGISVSFLTTQLDDKAKADLVKKQEHRKQLQKQIALSQIDNCKQSGQMCKLCNAETIELYKQSCQLADIGYGHLLCGEHQPVKN